MINALLQLIAPHYCYGCGKLGVVLCQKCKYDITDEPFSGCIVCAGPAVSGICNTHQTSYERAWCVGERSGTLERLIDAYKFERVKDAASPLASLLCDTLPVLPDTAIIVPLPTIQTHIRQRGYDHTLRIAELLAKDRKLECRKLLQRNDSYVQRGRNKKDRLEQARKAYRCVNQLDPSAIYILVDDVVTTNASVRFAADELKRAGATNVWAAVLARQALDKTP